MDWLAKPELITFLLSVDRTNTTEGGTEND
jgi:hypothetical protein